MVGVGIFRFKTHFRIPHVTLTYSFSVLKFTQSKKNEVTDTDPDSFPHFPANMAETCFAVKTESFESTITKHFFYLCVFCTCGQSIR